MTCPARELVASWMGVECKGKIMANGQPFDPSKYTAASWDYPLGTKLRVERNGRVVGVEVTDRGPAKRLLSTRQLDLSRKAFRWLAPHKQGLATVNVTKIQ